MHNGLAITFAVILILACLGIYKMRKEQKQARINDKMNDLINKEGNNNVQ
jgi:hypothetical protein